MNQNFIKKYGEWAIVTGSSNGIGRALAIEVAKYGLNVVLVARSAAKLEKLSGEIKSQSSVKTRFISMDLSEPGSVDQLIQQTIDLKIGLLVAAAGFGTSGPILKTSLSEELNMIDLNCRSAFEITHWFANRFAEQKRGGIILMSSLVGFQGVPNASNYAATKGYIQSLAEGLHFELRPYGVDVLASAPGPVNSGFADRAHMTMGKAATPEVVARVTIKELGKNLTIRPGFLSKFLGWSLALMNRWGRVRVMQIIMGGMTGGQSKI
ncbi:MAG: SDR family NAD(P)-dependent oxidoreductase [Xanthomonadaceae bacterium]|nr:SDR family NAD(P)-dependent oxidoreductase [Xanthomonadaceae bacterium]